MLLFWLVAAFVYCRGVNQLRLSLDTVRNKYASLGAMQTSEKMACVLVVLQILLWITRGNGKSATGGFGGWSSWFDSSITIGDGTVSILISLLLFVLPTHIVRWQEQHEIDVNMMAENNNTDNDPAANVIAMMTMPINDDDSMQSAEEESLPPQSTASTSTTTKQSKFRRAQRFARRPIKATSFLVEQDIHDIPWPVMFLLGAGFALADAFDKTGAMLTLATLMRPSFEALSPTALLVVVVSIVAILTGNMYFFSHFCLFFKKIFATLVFFRIHVKHCYCSYIYTTGFRCCCLRSHSSVFFDDCTHTVVDFIFPNLSLFGTTYLFIIAHSID